MTQALTAEQTARLRREVDRAREHHDHYEAATSDPSGLLDYQLGNLRHFLGEVEDILGGVS
jgi:hypothetical protein